MTNTVSKDLPIPQQPIILVDFNTLVFPDGWREVQQDKIQELAASIERLGVLNPIAVTNEVITDDPNGGEPSYQYTLVAGKHRALASHSIGLDTLPARLIDATQARLWYLSENLHRAELTVLERAEMVAEWIRLTEQKVSEPENSLAQVEPVKSRRADGRGGSVGAGINAATRTLGIERNQAQRSVKIDTITPEAKAIIPTLGLADNQTKLLEIAKAPPEQQVAVAQELVQAKVKTEVTAVQWLPQQLALAAKAKPEWIGQWLGQAKADDLVHYLAQIHQDELIRELRRRFKADGFRLVLTPKPIDQEEPAA